MPTPFEFVPPGGFGWIPLFDDGNFWMYRTESGIQAECNYQYMKIMGVEQWRGRMLNMYTDFMAGSDRFEESGLSNLSGCVAWVENNLMGGYYL